MARRYGRRRVDGIVEYSESLEIPTGVELRGRRWPSVNGRGEGVGLFRQCWREYE